MALGVAPAGAPPELPQPSLSPPEPRAVPHPAVTAAGDMGVATGTCCRDSAGGQAGDRATARAGRGHPVPPEGPRQCPQAGDRATARAGRGHPVPPEGPRQCPQAQVCLRNPSCPRAFSRFNLTLAGEVAPGARHGHPRGCHTPPASPVRTGSQEHPQSHCSSPPCAAFPGRFTSGKINQQLREGGREGGPWGQRGGQGRAHPPAGLGTEGQREGKGEERSENSSGARHGPAQPSLPPFLPSFLVFHFQTRGWQGGTRGWQGGTRGWQGGSTSDPSPGSPEPRACSDVTKLSPHHTATNPRRVCPSLGTLLSPCCDRGQ
ncbi:translation initiation factor IF-2-like isoform X1 [Passer montanus]|uniref:translation initiation factor IF-2-like isoform X1 n=1 Tax=Passer montanus TaxID=9160 RepID=UPI001960ECE9|nr:translation initiation factor IF-2-like isoform X1 [Passer montanus]